MKVLWPEARRNLTLYFFLEPWFMVILQNITAVDKKGGVVSTF